MGESKEEDACVCLLQGGYRKLKNRCGDIRRIKMRVTNFHYVVSLEYATMTLLEATETYKLWHVH